MKQQDRSESPLFKPGQLAAEAGEITHPATAPMATMYNKAKTTISTSFNLASTYSGNAESNANTPGKRKVRHTLLDVAAYFAELDRMIENGELENEIPAYDPTEEKLPADKVSVFRPGFTNALFLIKHKVAQRILNAVQALKLKCPSAELDHMEQRIKKLLSPSFGRPVSVGWNGNAGKGKTSSINAVLSVANLAHTSSGSVATYVPVEYLPLGDREAPYAFEPKICLPEEALKCIRDYWEDYYGGMLWDDKDEDDMGATDAVKPARDAFLALFSDIKQFANEETLDDFLGQATSIDDPKILSKLLKWGKERYDKLYQILAMQRGRAFEAQTPDDLGEIMRPYLQTATDPCFEGHENLGLKNSVWPFVKFGRVSLNHPLLDHIIIADLASHNDCNRQRVRLTQNYIKTCQVAVMVDEVKRAGDNEPFKQSIFEVWRRRRGDSVVVVLTHTDDIGDDASCKPPLELDEQDALDSLKAHKIVYEQKCKKIGAKCKEPAYKKDPALRAELNDQRDNYKAHVTHATILRKRILIGARNRQVKTALKTWFRDKTGVKVPLSVFCVSTTKYMELIEPDDERTLKDPPVFTPESTEIIALRRHLLTLVNKRGQEQSIVNYYRLVKHLLNEMSLACTGFKPMCNRNSLIRFIQEAHESLPDLCRQHRLGFTKLLEPVLEVFSKSMQEWLRKAESKCEKFGNYNANSYGTFLKRHGVHKRPNQKKENWNLTLLDFALGELEPLLTILCSQGCNTFANDLMQAFHNQMDDLERELRFKLDQTQIKLFGEFFENLQLQNKQLEVLVRSAVRTLKEGLLKVGHEVTSLEAKGNPFLRHMKHTYTSIMEQYPPKSGKPAVHINRRTMFKKAVTDPVSGPYQAIKTHIETQASVLLQTADSALKKGCDEIFVEIFHNFDQICPEQEDYAFKALERGKELRGDIEQARQVLEGEVKEALLSAGIKVA
ncbi:hypothetical protein HBI56_100790 [Parastagonospora nodorum]|nr:hypothetical protein HBH53_178400 [Parastagonospora nodorum]KAH4006173.1 hypothetical protein HBI10_023290 [Parastagonospora nodorum]KAH4012001.1 hypothetical protein HBI13_193650 [Parastagonospora nodorum]KAH4175975.1 hypothetical protein HBH43_069400 [Parastagonospora nodorum]KAH4408222.1 hypothetical protein HBH92_154220 [Parastagonospora nodorum]